MAIRRNIGGRYVEVREKNSSKGKKGTIMGNWSNKNSIKKFKHSKLFLVFLFFISLVLVLIVKKYFFN